VGALGKSGIDRAHNQILDSWVTAGLLGFASFMVLIGGLFYYGLKWLGLIKNPRQAASFFGALSSGCALGLLVPWILDGSLRFAGVGTAAGLLLGLGGFLLASVAGRSRSAAFPDPATSHQPAMDILLIALLSSLIAHFVEIQTSMAIAATSTYFWLFAAMIVALGARLSEEPAPEQAPPAAPKAGNPSGKRARRRHDGKERPQPAVAAKKRSSSGLPNASLMAYSLLIGLILVTWSYGFVNNQIDLKAHSFSAIWLAGTAWYLSYWFVLTIPAANLGEARQRRNLDWLPFALSGIQLLLFLAFHWTAVRQDDAAYAIFVYGFWLVLGIMAIGVILTRDASLPGPVWRKANGVAYVLLVAVTLAISVVTNLNVARADVYLKKATAFGANGQWSQGLPYLQRASGLAAGYNEYHKLLANYALESWRADPNRDPRWLEEAQEALEREARIAPLGPEGLAKMGFVHLVLGETAEDSALRQERLAKASEYYQQAIALSPWPADIYREWGKVYHDLARYDQAIERYEQALKLDDRAVDTHLALGDAYEAMGDLDQAIQAYTQAVEVDPNSVQAHNSLGYEYSLKGDWEKAIQETRKAAELAPDNYLIHQNLGSYYESSGQIDQAIVEVNLALSLAPRQQKPVLENALARLEQKKAAGSAQP
jgi:tetratricopeptide (TPR) repeat protein